MGDWLDLFVIYLFGSGIAFFLGVAFLFVGLGISSLAAAGAGGIARNLLVLIGAIFVVISAAPLPEWFYALLASITFLWLLLEWFWPASTRTIRMARSAVLIVWLVALGLELPYHFASSLPPMGKPKLFLIGDSVSAGTRPEETGTWPKLLAKQQQIDVRDFSEMGAKLGSARKQAARIGTETGLVVLEIGGNDLLGTTSAEQFEERLDQLLSDVCRQERIVVMLELPLQPFANRFGLIQRRLARKHDVFLIPKSAFIAILTTPGATMDGIHLTSNGHALMAEMMWDHIRAAYGTKE